MLRQYQRPVHYNDLAATIANSVIIPLALLLHIVSASFFYIVEIECPARMYCLPTENNGWFEKSRLILVLNAAAAAGLLCMWCAAQAHAQQRRQQPAGIG